MTLIQKLRKTWFGRLVGIFRPWTAIANPCASKSLYKKQWKQNLKRARKEKENIEQTDGEKTNQIKMPSKVHNDGAMTQFTIQYIFRRLRWKIITQDQDSIIFLFGDYKLTTNQNILDLT